MDKVIRIDMCNVMLRALHNSKTINTTTYKQAQKKSKERKIQKGNN